MLLLHKNTAFSNSKSFVLSLSSFHLVLLKSVYSFATKKTEAKTSTHKEDIVFEIHFSICFDIENNRHFDIQLLLLLDSEVCLPTKSTGQLQVKDSCGGNLYIVKLKKFWKVITVLDDTSSTAVSVFSFDMFQTLIFKRLLF